MTAHETAHDTPERIALNARDVAFDWSSLPVHWIPGEPFATHLLDVLHLLLPEGERWFVRVFAEALPLIKDPQLAEDVRGFVGQEAVHAQSHQGVLEHFAAQGRDVSPYVEQVEYVFREALGERGLTGAEARAWLVDRIALVAAVEHVTAFLGQWILDAKGLDRAQADPTMLDMLRWHGAEEVEHRSVAHDLYTHLDGSYWRRIRMEITVVPMLVRLWAHGAAFLLATDPQPQRARWVDVARAARKGLCPRFVETTVALLSYLRPGYHPSHHGSTDRAVGYLAVSPAARAAESRGAA